MAPFGGSQRSLVSLRCLLCSYALRTLALALLVGVGVTTADVACRPIHSWSAALSARCLCEPCDLCAYSFLRLQCEPIAASGGVRVERALASEPFVQPLLEPEDWLLTTDEIVASRNGIARPDLQRWTDGNDVQLLTSTDRFFSSVADDLDALESDTNASVFLTAWELDDVPFRPLQTNWQQSTFKARFGAAMDRGVRVRALLWTNVLRYAANVALQQWINARGTGICLFDNRLPYATSSHHQKTIVLASTRGAVAFVGGIDLTGDRWDTPQHNASAVRRSRHLARSHDGWIDASLRLRGAAVADVAANFVGRWNDHAPPLRAQEALLEFSNPTLSADDATLAVPPSSRVQGINGSATVQIVRTYSCKTAYALAPRGERSVLAARLKAIQQARNFVYIEDQFFVLVPELQHALLERLRAGLQALVVVTQRPELSTAVAGYEKLLYDMLQPLVAAFPDRVLALTPRPELELYVHTKALVVDDVFLSLGSANWNRRSMTSDSEVAASVVDRARVVSAADGVTVARAARQFRLQKFSEFSGRSAAELASMSVRDAIRALERSTADGAGLLTALTVEKALYFDLLPSGFQDEVDPDDTCVF